MLANTKPSTNGKEQKATTENERIEAQEDKPTTEDNPITQKSTSSNEKAYTVCFCGTGCTRDEGETDRDESDKRIYSKNTGYIPVRIHMDISKKLTKTTPSITVRGVGENDWSEPRDDSEPLIFNHPLNAPKDLLDYVKSYSGGDQRGKGKQLTGWQATALALHGANLAASSGYQKYNFIGHSRGAVECIMAAWFLYAYGKEAGFSNIPVNIFAIDPVPGPGNWYGILTQLPPNVVNYVGVYAWDELDTGFTALVPRPNGLMIGKPEEVELKDTENWKKLADNFQLADPLALAPEGSKQPNEDKAKYELYACRGKHSTVAGNTTGDGKYDPQQFSPSVAPVPELVYKLARAYLTKWGTTFSTKSTVEESAIELRKKIHTDHRKFDAMGGGETRTSVKPLRPYVRRVSSISGRLPWNTYYLDNVVGDPPYKLAYPVTIDRSNDGWVKWKFL